MPEIDMAGYRRIALDEMSTQGALNLAQAVVEQAVHDWRVAVKAEKKHKGQKLQGARETRKACERFFLSDWFTDLTGVDGAVLLRKLKEETK